MPNGNSGSIRCITLSAFADQKIFGSLPCPIVVSQVSWLLTTPSMAHDLVSKDADNVYDGRDALPIKSYGFTNPYTGSASRPFYEVNNLSGIKGT